MKMFADSVPIALQPKVPYLKITADKIKQRGVLFMDFLLDGIMSRDMAAMCDVSGWNLTDLAGH